MLKRSIFLTSASLLLFFLFSCTSVDSPEDTRVPVTIHETPIDFSGAGFNKYLKTYPSKGSPVFFASVQRMSDREKEKAAALLNASEQASKYIAVKAVSKFYSEKLNSSIKYMHDLDVLWDRELALDMIDRLEVLQVSQDTYGTYLTSTLPDYSLGSIPWMNITASETSPSWTNLIPEIPGYIVSVGIALQTGYVADSFKAADNQALEDLARQISVDIISGRKVIENGIGTAALLTNYEESEVVIPGFYILERWRSPDAHYYYSLAIAPADIVSKY